MNIVITNIVVIKVIISIATNMTTKGQGFKRKCQKIGTKEEKRNFDIPLSGEIAEASD